MITLKKTNSANFGLYYQDIQNTQTWLVKIAILGIPIILLLYEPHKTLTAKEFTVSCVSEQSRADSFWTVTASAVLKIRLFSVIHPIMS
jgi:hypothetical protein